MGRGQGGRIFLLLIPLNHLLQKSAGPIAGAKIRLLKLIRTMQFKDQRSTQQWSAYIN